MQFLYNYNGSEHEFWHQPAWAWTLAHTWANCSPLCDFISLSPKNIPPKYIRNYSNLIAKSQITWFKKWAKDLNRHFFEEDIQMTNRYIAAAAMSLQSCPTLCNPIDGSPPGSPVPGTLQARTLEWIAISFSNAWKWKVKVKSLSHVRLLATPWTAAY